MKNGIHKLSLVEKISDNGVGKVITGTILFISHVNPMRFSAGNEIRIYKMVQWLKKEGFKIVLLLNHPILNKKDVVALESVVDFVYFLDDYNIDNKEVLNVLMENKILVNSLLRDSVTKVKNICLKLFRRNTAIQDQQSKSAKNSLCPDKLIYVTHQLCLKYNPHAVIAEYIFTTPCLDIVPKGIVKIVDTHDMFSRKGEQVISYGIPDLLECTSTEERNYLLKSDIVIAIQAHEAELFRKIVPEKEVITVGIDYTVVDEIDHDASIPGTILVVGSDNPLNVHGLKEFYNNSWPLIRNASNNAVLRIIGKIGNHLKTDDPRVQISGWVENLDDEYKKATVVINPILAGTGLKIKSVEALCNAKALVATSNGVEGICFTGDPPFIVCNDWRDFAEAVLMILNSDEKRKVLQLKALAFSKNEFNSEKVYAPLAKSLEKNLSILLKHNA